MRWEGRRQSNNIEDRRGMRVSRGGLVGGGLGTLAIALLVMFLGGDPTPILQGAGNAPVQTTTEPYVENAAEAKRREFVATMLAATEDLWAGQFAAKGGRYQPPRLVLFREKHYAEAALADLLQELVPADDRSRFFDQVFDQRRGGGGAPGGVYAGLAHGKEGFDLIAEV